MSSGNNRLSTPMVLHRRRHDKVTRKVLQQLAKRTATGRLRKVTV